MIIRTMEAADIPAVAALEAANFSMPWSKTGFFDILGREDVVFLVAYESDALLGYVGAYCTAQEGEITNVAVAAEHRRQGIARGLLCELIRRLEQMGVFRIVLEVRRSNEPAIRLYEQMDFSVAGTRKNFYEKPTEDAYVMIYQGCGREE